MTSLDIRRSIISALITRMREQGIREQVWQGKQHKEAYVQAKNQYTSLV